MDLSDLDLDLSALGGVPSRRGRRPKPLEVQVIGEIDEAEALELILLPNTDSQVIPAIQRLKTSHHNLARLLAEGRSDIEASQITGYTTMRIRQLREDPAFKELLSYYGAMVEEVYVNVHQRLASLGLDVLEELQHRLDTDPESFTVRELKELSETFLDRSGYGPKTTQVHEIGTDMSALLEAVKQEVRERQNGRIAPLDAKANPPEGERVGDGGGPILEAELHSETKVVRLTRQGEDL